MAEIKDEFTRFEHEGWQRVADKYDSAWSSLTRQFIPYLINAAPVSPAMSVLDVGICRLRAISSKQSAMQESAQPAFWRASRQKD